MLYEVITDLFLLLAPENPAKLRQGVTTEILGQDGIAMAVITSYSIHYTKLYDILPGLLICLTCMSMIAALGRRLGLPKATGGPSLRGILVRFKDAIIALIMPTIILGGILGGVVTPTEAASIAVFYALAVGLAYRRISFADIVDMLILV